MNRIVIAVTFRRLLRSAAFRSFLALVAIVSLGLSQFDSPAAGWPGLVTLLAVILGAGSIGPELSSGRLQLILVKPITRSAYLLSRFAGIVVAVWVAAITGAVCELLGRAFGYAEEIGAMLMNSMYDVVFIVALLTLLGSLTRAYYNVAIYIGAQVVLGILGGFGEKLPVPVMRAITAVERNLFPDTPSRFELDWFLLVTSNAAIALVLACLAFRRREVPYGAE